MYKYVSEYTVQNVRIMKKDNPKMSNAQIARCLGISRESVRKYINNKSRRAKP